MTRATVIGIIQFMAILTLSNVSQSFGDFDVFRGASGSIPNDGKVGLVGPNGIGKTTLLLVLAKEAVPSGGAIHMARGTRLGYLPQEASRAFADSTNNVYEELTAVFSDLKRLETKLQAMEQQMADGTLSDELMAEYSNMQIRFETAGGYDYDLRIKQVLTGLGFKEEQWTLPLAHLSGGQKTRVLLGRLLLERPDLLILDEPTNHLDVEAIEWLEGMLRIWNGAILIVSHDRYFLDRVVKNIWELGREGIESYRGNYSAYVLQRGERWAQRQREYDDFMAHVDKEVDFIRKNISSQRTQMAQGKLSRLSREVAAVLGSGLDVLGVLRTKGWLYVKETMAVAREAQSFSELQQQLPNLHPPRKPIHLKMRLTPSHRSGELVLRTKGLEIGYPGTSLFECEDIELRRKECAALIGSNGAGKSTFLKTVLETLDPLAGEIRLGASLELAYFAQAHDSLNLENSVLDELLAHKPMLISEARNYLGQFLFRQDDVYKKVSSLSGGERGRLALSILSLEKANFLLLDEPTNHLDIGSQEVLQEALENYEGTTLMVTHDRYLVDRLATQIWELRNGRLHVFNGGYQAFLAARERETAVAKEEAALARAESKAAVAVEKEKPQLSKNALRRQAEALEALENRIAETEEEIDNLSAELQKATEAQSFDKIQALSNAYAQAETQLEDLMTQWETLADE
ncbi:MAG: ATP-binding cassette domain-containing protein [Chloroflexota bacterium]